MNPYRRIGLFTALLLLGACGGSGGSGAINIAGKVIDNGLRPLAGAVVTVGSQNAVSDSNGQFSISNVTPPYDLTAIAMSPAKVGVLYLGLRRADPTILVPEEVLTSQKSGTVTGNVTGGDPLGAANEMTATAWGSPEFPIVNPSAVISSNP